MPRRCATILQAEVARIIRAAKQGGASTVEVPLPSGEVVVIRLRDEVADEKK